MRVEPLQLVFYGALACGAAFAFPIVLLICTVILRKACRMAGVRPPDFQKAMGIAFLVGSLRFLVSLGLVFLIDKVPVADEMTKSVLACLVGSCAGMLISASVYRVALEKVSFLRGMVIWLAETILMMTLVTAVVVVLVFLARFGVPLLKGFMA